MLFSSITFIYYFLPILLIVYFIVPSRYRNLVLLIFSLLFYFLGEPKYIIVLILSCVINYVFSKLMIKKKTKILLILAIIYNVGQLLIFKYTDFFIENVNSLFGFDIEFMRIVMPIGISFFTFQALGYVIDVYNEKHPPANSLMEFMTYISLFPQLIAGPIVRYADVRDALKNRTTNFSKMSEGIKRFIIGLSKKVLLANILGEFVELCVEETLLSSWLRPIAFTLQIYFDFSGYSDMAIGLGLMFGFRFLENFNYPLIASSITDFWRRWHISLSSWFRDYVYIPLGGNRVSKLKFIRNNTANAKNKFTITFGTNDAEKADLTTDYSALAGSVETARNTINEIYSNAKTVESNMNMIRDNLLSIFSGNENEEKTLENSFSHSIEYKNKNVPVCIRLDFSGLKISNQDKSIINILEFHLDTNNNNVITEYNFEQYKYTDKIVYVPVYTSPVVIKIFVTTFDDDMNSTTVKSTLKYLNYNVFKPKN